MPLYNFTLTLSGVTIDTAGLEDALFDSGCDDALVCFYGTAVYLEFDRESPSLSQAILSAIRDVESASVNACVESVDSALVGLSDIAAMTGLSRQAVALLKEGSRGPRNFPGPVQRLKGNSPLWRWRTVAEWLVREKRMRIDDPLVVNAGVFENINLALQLRATREVEDVKQYASQLDVQHLWA
nr:DNA-binding protein [uncultured Enterobacter sp.]